ncbi:hypothetical protein [Azonexus fungiphilus]|uniref:hypothetical protein n=1 Tax=Azonexus fungiphilus TaxID=146940 RepID=UPI00156AEDDB|nr:hypothetical protein [Azonexus fungiphilus]NHC05474.1 hypothetical protein [Azonexus fungiphilus]
MSDMLRASRLVYVQRNIIAEKTPAQWRRIMVHRKTDGQREISAKNAKARDSRASATGFRQRRQAPPCHGRITGSKATIRYRLQRKGFSR